MREIKFRVWGYDGSHIGKKEIFVPCCDEFNDINDNISNLQDEEMVFMQYTGLKDKTTDRQNEVYEYDIILDENNKHWKVEWDYRDTGWCVILIGTSKKRRLIDKLLKGALVVGNIYENPELLKS